MTSPSHNTYKYKDQAKLNALTDLVVNNIDKIYSYFDTEPSYKNNILIKSPCFIHGGDNPTALNLYYNADIFAIEDDISDELLEGNLNDEIFYFKNEKNLLAKLDEYLNTGKLNPYLLGSPTPAVPSIFKSL